MEAYYYSLIRPTKDGRLVAWIPDRLGVAASSIGEDEIVREHPRRAPKLSSRWLSRYCRCPRRASSTTAASRPGSISTSRRRTSPNRRARDLRCTATSGWMCHTFDFASLPSAVRRSFLAYRPRRKVKNRLLPSKTNQFATVEPSSGENAQVCAQQSLGDRAMLPIRSSVR